MVRYFLLIGFFVFRAISLFSTEESFLEKPNSSHLKLLVLVIASDKYNERPMPIYAELENVWRSYMHLDPDHVEAYFIKADPDLPTIYQVCDDVIWSKTVENIMPGILNKTLLSLECLSERLGEFDYVLRANLSSFFVLPALLKALETQPRKGCYFASGTIPGSSYGSGCGFVISSDLARMLVEGKNQMYNSHDWDDVKIAQFLISKGIRLRPAVRLDFSRAAEWNQFKTNINPDVFHFRIKDNIDIFRENEKVYNDDLYMHYDMLNVFYGVK